MAVRNPSAEEAPPTITVDITADLNAKDHTGYVWTFLDEARAPRLIVPDAVVIADPGGAPAIAVVVDLVDHPTGVEGHLDILRGTVEDYRALCCTGK